MTNKFTDAQLMAVRHPDTSTAPTQKELSRIAIGDYVKICAMDWERFWVLVTGIKGELLTGEVNNDLLMAVFHGLRCGDAVVFERRHVYQVEG